MGGACQSDRLVDDLVLAQLSSARDPTVQRGWWLTVLAPILIQLEYFMDSQNCGTDGTAILRAVRRSECRIDVDHTDQLVIDELLDAQIQQFSTVSNFG